MVGAGQAALETAALLLEHGALPTVVAPYFHFRSGRRPRPARGSRRSVDGCLQRGRSHRLRTARHP
ncbi:hypothetical protein ACFCXA_32690 [Streptomyces virginiae]|uniref:hypothetical protein n=1 Tax=Streptomyces virginiae TaxID=1961 RepID=UPI0035DA5C1F